MARATTGMTPTGRPDLTASDLTSRDAVLRAIAEARSLGRDAFLAKHGFRRALWYELEHEGERYDSKAIVGVALGYQYGRQNELRSGWFTGGDRTVVPALENLGFMVVDTRQQPADSLEVGFTYSWADLGTRFGFDPGWLNRVGGMASLPAHNAVLVITHPGGGESFNYNDYWDGADLIYTGKGQSGDQQLTSENGYVANNSREILVFEHRAAALLAYLGSARCTDVRPDIAPGRNGVPRRVYRFRLHLETGPAGNDAPQAAATATATTPPTGPRTPASPNRRPRPFDPQRPPAPALTRGGDRPTPEEILARQEKATQGHFELLKKLLGVLEHAGWRETQEVPSAIDLRSSCPVTGGRVIFEAKTVGARSEARRMRSALAQLFEYRYYHGDPSDELCVVSSSPVSAERLRFLRALSIDAIWFDAGKPVTVGAPCSPSVTALLDHFA